MLHIAIQMAMVKFVGDANTMKRLRFDNSSLINIQEAKTKILTEFENRFGKDFVYSPKMDFEFTTKSFSIVYSILNTYLFGNNLNQKNLYVYECSVDDLRDIINKINVSVKIDPNNIYASYVPEINNKTGKLSKEAIFIVEQNTKTTFLFAVSELCHEMIHQYDAHHGILLQLLKEDIRLGIDRSHETPIFVRYMKLASLEGIRVMINGNNTPFDILNQEAVQFTLNLQEDDNSHFFELVERLKAGEKIQNVCLTNHDTVAFFIP